MVDILVRGERSEPDSRGTVSVRTFLIFGFGVFIATLVAVPAVVKTWVDLDARVTSAVQLGVSAAAGMATWLVAFCTAVFLLHRHVR